MSLKHALLGFLNYGPHTGYELKKFFDVSVAHFWNAELSQIYPTLKQLESEGLVEMKVHVQEDRPNRKVYSITEDGRRELVEWLATPADPDQVREPLLIKVFFGSAMAKRELISVLQQRAEELRHMVAVYERSCDLAQKFATAIGLDKEAFFWNLTLDAGVKHTEASLQWIESAIVRIEEMDESVFQSEPYKQANSDAKTRAEILDKLKSAALHAFAGPLC